jgi:hypothetical protein
VTGGVTAGGVVAAGESELEPPPHNHGYRSQGRYGPMFQSQSHRIPLNDGESAAGQRPSEKRLRKRSKEKSLGTGHQ